MVKTANTGSGPGGSKASLNRERYIYEILLDNPALQADKFIRSCHDFIGDWDSQEIACPEHVPCMVLEWMDCELRHVPYLHLREKPNLVRTIARSVLSALVVFSEGLGKMHTGGQKGTTLLRRLHWC